MSSFENGAVVVFSSIGGPKLLTPPFLELHPFSFPCLHRCCGLFVHRMSNRDHGKTRSTHSQKSEANAENHKGNAYFQKKVWDALLQVCNSKHTGDTLANKQKTTYVGQSGMCMSGAVDAPPRGCSMGGSCVLSPETKPDVEWNLNTCVACVSLMCKHGEYERVGVIGLDTVDVKNVVCTSFVPAHHPWRNICPCVADRNFNECHL